METVIVGIKETGRDSFRLTFNGRVLGDSRGYPEDRAKAEARKYDGRPTGRWEGSVWVDQVYRVEV